MSVIFKRVSVRKYEAKPVEEEKVREMIQAGCAAPSAGNQQEPVGILYSEKSKHIRKAFQSASVFRLCQGC